MKLIIILLGISSQVWSCQDGTGPTVVLPTKDWWETAQFYQIYPRSFKDSNGDGIGDLNGITEKLDHLKDLGITATWLSPIYKSPMIDFGYDISDFQNINPEYGSMSDFDALIRKANALGLKVIMDFVPNHSSDKHEWFLKSVNGDPDYKDFYVWADGITDPSNPEKKLPPSNWLQAFHGSAWEWNDNRKQFYLHQFAVQQPDLNYRNPKVVEAMKNVLKFWLDKGVAGFRVDAVPWCFEIEPFPNGTYKDEPTSGFTDDPTDPSYLQHIYTQDQPETTDMVYQWRKLLDDYKKEHGGDTRVLMVETYSALEQVMKFYGNTTTKGAHIPFNFNFITRANNQSTAYDLIRVINYWMMDMPRGDYVPNWVMGNHDQRRVGSRYGQQRIDIMNMILMMLPGASITYMGEEIGMLDGNLSWEDSVDPSACNTDPDQYERFTRDPERTPFQWDTSVSSGFSTNLETWLPVNPNYRVINVASQTTAAKSHLKVYKELVKLRRGKTLLYGDLKQRAFDADVLAIHRSLSGEETLVLVANIGGTAKTVDISAVGTMPNTLRYKIVGVSSNRSINATVSKTAVSLQPYESFILSG